MKRPLLALLLTAWGLPAAGPAPKRLSELLLRAVREARFDEVVDFGPYDGACPGAAFCPSPAPRIAVTPNVDVAVLELDRDGRLRSAANVVLSRDYPRARNLRIASRTLRAGGVRWLRWDSERFDGGTFSSKTGERLTTKGWKKRPPVAPDEALTPPRGRTRFRAPYPASLFKIMVAFHLLRLVDGGKVSLDEVFAHKDQTLALARWLDLMITESSNEATAAVLRKLHSLGEVDRMNAYYRGLGLETLQIAGTTPETGRPWGVGKINLTALDIAKLFWLIDGGPGTLWRGPTGRTVTRAELSEPSRAHLKRLLSEQSFNDVLSTTNLCGAANVRPGLPSRVAERWIDPADGHVATEGVNYGADARPCNARAEVTFAHKTGLTLNYASDAGIVEALPGHPYRHYIVAFVANLGHRYADPVFAARTSFPCYDKVGPICYTQRIPALGRQIDDWMKNRAPAAASR